MGVTKRISDEAFKVLSSSPIALIVTHETLQVTIGIFFAVALVAATARMIIRLKLHKKLRLDDICVIFACVCLVCAPLLLDAREAD